MQPDFFFLFNDVITMILKFIFHEFNCYLQGTSQIIEFIMNKKQLHFPNEYNSKNSEKSLISRNLKNLNRVFIYII